MRQIARTTDAQGYVHILEEDDRGTVSWFSFHEDNDEHANYVEIPRDLRVWLSKNVAVKEVAL